ncbi:nucleotidyl transferase AbiEii/AbiGii toxin family protein [Paenarthrobacter sp. NPDC090520]|uniref:nucleotidyl transferase AbiEii/AbiGii toxin family protein n=1 Tax=Paenarthrobacter sp. NPDC090520 TaxID=3364382 RepID=UPI00380514E3
MKYGDLPARVKPAKTASSLLAAIRNTETGEPDQVTTWTIAASVLMAALQRPKGSDGKPFLRLKGGAYLEWSLHPAARATQDVDTFFTAEADRFDSFLREALTGPLGDFTFVVKARTGDIEVALAATNPRRHEIQIFFARKLFRKVVLEVSFLEGAMDTSNDSVPAPRLEPFGIPTPAVTLASISPEYQVAQKLHACTGPGHEERERDVLDILLLKRNVFDPGLGTEPLLQACEDIFRTRARIGSMNGVQAKVWPTAIVIHENWGPEFATLAGRLGMDIDLAAAIEELNDWAARFQP